MNVCLVGASGTAGRSILSWLGSDLSVLAVSRSRPVDALPAHVRWKHVDIEQRHSIRAALRDEPVDTLIYAAAGQPIVSQYEPIHVGALRRLAQRIGRRASHDAAEYYKTALITQTYDPGH